MKFKIFLLVATVLLLFPCLALAGQYGPVFQQMINQANSNEMLHGMVFLADTFDAPAAAKRITDRGFTMARRHEIVIQGLQEKAADTQYDLLDKIESRQGQVAYFRPFWIVNAIEIKAQKSFFEFIVKRSDISQIRFIPEIELIEPVEISPSVRASRGIEGGISDSRAPELWALGITGEGALVCDVDTGADGTHPAFADRWRGLDDDVTADAAWYDPVTSTDFPFDAASHGTHTMGTIIGDDGAGNQIGMAPDAKWIAAGVIDRVDIVQTITDAYAAFEWAVDPDQNPGTSEDVPDVINNSWGYRTTFPPGYPVCDDFMWPAMDNVEAAGAVVVFAAGNEGTSGLRMPGDRITSDINAFSIGAIMQNGTTIASFSSRGPSDCDSSTIKPEVCAVGDNVRSSIPGGGYSTMSGTSMATPHVAGAVALLRSAVPDSTPEEIKQALYFSAVDLGPVGEDNTFGNGKIDLVAAHQMLLSLQVCDYDEDGHEKARCGGDDCNDMNENVYPGADEICDGLDSNCDGNTPADEADTDKDGHFICGDDCNDEDETVYTGAPELCDGIDNDCDQELGDNELDGDEDGYSECDGDCGPENPDVYPGAEEICDGLDTNCDGTIPLNDRDFDNDGVPSCAGDCAPLNPNIYPGAEEGCDGLDNDCSGEPDDSEVDWDNDGWFECDGDCEPNNPAVSPIAIEQCNGIDDNCDSVLMPGEEDADQDGFLGCDNDCDDNDPNSYPFAEEICDGKDNDCDGFNGPDEYDMDNDTYPKCNDCDDDNPMVHPDGIEVCDNGRDDNCDGLTDGDDPLCSGQPDDDDDNDDESDDDDDSVTPDDDDDDDSGGCGN